MNVDHESATNLFFRNIINLDITHRCTLQCPACPRQTIRRSNKKIQGHDMSNFEFDIIVNNFKTILFCGNLSDPIFHPRFIYFLEKAYSKNVHCIISTAASHKKIKWYKKAFLSNPDAEWIFGMDGLPKESHKYRINQDGEKLWKIMLLGKSLIKNITWQYIIFSYNENNIEEAKSMANKNNIKLELMKTSRFPRGEYSWMIPSEKYLNV